MNGNLVGEVNECYLFHGTKSDVIDRIEHNGFDFRISGENAMFGKGVYFAESSTKADQYVGMSDLCCVVRNSLCSRTKLYIVWCTLSMTNGDVEVFALIIKIFTVYFN